MTHILKLLALLGMVSICSCSNDEVKSAPENENNQSSEIYLYAINSPKPQEDVAQEDHTQIPQQDQEGKLILTGDDILWFNPETREIKFKDFVPTSATFRPYDKIQFKLGDLLLFEANAYVNAIYSQIFTDLVIFHDLENDTYYLNDCYPPIEAVQQMEETQANIQARQKNWNLFLDALKAENRLK